MLLKENKDDEIIFSSIEGESILFSIGDPSIIIDIIRKKIYNHPIRTMVQEYLSNAKDACVEAGKESSDIHVTLPTSLNPEFIIRDYGVGMSDARVRDVFVQYGISTKRDSKKQLGCFGIGAKSGWAYSDSFMVESFYEGIHRQYIADIAHTREGRLLLFKESETEEPNGVLIKIPVEVKDIPAFKIAYTRATFLWKDKPTLKDPICYPECIFSYDNIKIFKGFSTYVKSESHLLAGVYLDGNGVPFLVDTIKDPSDVNIKVATWCLNSGYAVVIKADPYKMNISANREGFVNQKYASEKVEEAYRKLRGYARNLFKAATLKDYLKIYSENYWLIALDLKNYPFSNEPYELYRYGTDTRTRFSLKDGYFLKLAPRSIFIKMMKADLTFYTDFRKHEIYLSRSKALVSINFKNLKATPELLDETKKALTYGRTFGWDVAKDRYVFFQSKLSDDKYLEIAQIIGAKEYIEDLYLSNIAEFNAKRKEERRLLKAEREKEGKVKKEVTEPLIKVYLFKRQYNRLRYCGKEKSFANLHHILPMNYLTFYGGRCEKSDFNFIKSLPLNIALVHASKKEIEAIGKLNDPKLKPMSDLTKHLKEDQIILKSVNDIWHVKVSRDFWKYFNRYTKLVSKKFDIVKLMHESQIVLKHLDRLENNSMYATFGEHHKHYKGYCVFKDFMQTYPLLKNLNNLHTITVEDINLYIEAVELKNGY